MHMADALLSPAVGGTMWAAAAGAIAWCSARIKKGVDDRTVPLMGVLGAFVFAAQMINFTIPATGSSGHLGGGLLLTILLGPYAAFLTIASVLMVQALFFADGGLLALGCNIINLGIWPAFVAYPLIYRPLAGQRHSGLKMAGATVLAAIASLQLGALSVVLETVLSGISALPFSAFVTMMQPVHLAIGLVEGLITVIIVKFVGKARPDIFNTAEQKPGILRSIAPAFLALALFTGGILSWFASEKPDGLEWSIEKITGKSELAATKDGPPGRLATIQDKLAFLPDYNFRKTAAGPEARPHGGPIPTAESGTGGRPDRLGTSLAGVIGALITLALAGVIGLVLRRRQQEAASRPHSHEHSHSHHHHHDHMHRHGELVHSHGHEHEHSHPHPHVHDHSQPHPADPNPRHSHSPDQTEHEHGHGESDHGSHDHRH